VIEEIDGPVINALATVVFTPSSFSWRLKKLIFSFIMLGVFSHVAFLVAILIAGYIFREAAENSISLAGRGLIVISLFRWFSRVLVSGQVKDYWRLAVFVVFGFILVPYSLGLWINLWLVHKYSTFQSVWGVGFAHYYMLLLIVQLASSRELRPWPMTYINRQTIRQSAVDMIEALENLQHLRFPRASIVFRDFILPMASAVGILRYLPRLYILVAHLFLLASMIYCSKRILLIEKIRKSEYLIGRQLRNYF
jgi:hypothetical protein